MLKETLQKNVWLFTSQIWTASGKVSCLLYFVFIYVSFYTTCIRIKFNTKKELKHCWHLVQNERRFKITHFKKAFQSWLWKNLNSNLQSYSKSYNRWSFYVTSYTSSSKQKTFQMKNGWNNVHNKMLHAKKYSQSVGFEPTLPEGIWFLVRRLNRSAMTARCEDVSL